VPCPVTHSLSESEFDWEPLKFKSRCNSTAKELMLTIALQPGRLVIRGCRCGEIFVGDGDGCILVATVDGNIIPTDS
jgi:hypothetical protein